MLIIRNAVFAALVAASSPALGQTSEDVRAAIEAGNSAYIAAMEKADARAFAEVYDAEGVRLVGGGEVVRGRAAIMDYFGSFFTRVGPVEVTLEMVEVWVVDDLAYESGRWSYAFTPPGDSRRTVGGRYVTVWRQQADGDWKIFADIGVPGTES